MNQKEYILEVQLHIAKTEHSYEGLRVSNNYKVKAPDLLGILRILAELEAYTRKLAETFTPPGRR
ncbi:MAG: hypothetical protein HWN68_10905 [Desulfobacterales bacterium]|nr:hypothetical protein [Desulfobacterales bacterium]